MVFLVYTSSRELMVGHDGDMMEAITTMIMILRFWGFDSQVLGF